MTQNKFLFFAIILLFSTVVFSQKNKGDTLYFEYEKSYLEKRFYQEPNFLFIKDTGNDGEYFFFKIVSEFTNKTSQKTISLKNYIRKSDFYNDVKKIKLNDYELYKHLKDFTIYLIKPENSNNYILVKPMIVIE